MLLQNVVCCTTNGRSALCEKLDSYMLHCKLLLFESAVRETWRSCFFLSQDLIYWRALEHCHNLSCIGLPVQEPQEIR